MNRADMPPPRGNELTRRRWLALVAATTAGPFGVWSRGSRAAASGAPLTRRIPSSGEVLPVVGLGSWITFNVGGDQAARAACVEVVRAFFAAGGRLIDSSPMYGSSQPTIGFALAQIGRPAALFSAEKVWIGDAARGPAQIEASRAYWGVARFDLMQVHNLLSWQQHLPRLFEMKAAGKLRYVGITTSEGRRHAEIEQVMRTPAARLRAAQLQPARPRGRACACCRWRRSAASPSSSTGPSAKARCCSSCRATACRAGRREIDCEHWAQVALKFIVSHPAVTCAIPATSQVAHLRQNMAAAHGRMPDAALRSRMARDVAAL